MIDLISRQSAIDAVRVMQTYKLSEGDDMLLVDQAEVMTELMMLPSAEPNSNDMSGTRKALDTIRRHDAIETFQKELCREREYAIGFSGIERILNALPSAEPEIIRCKDCKHNPKDEWFGCPMSHLSEAQRPETAWCWKAERRTDG